MKSKARILPSYNWSIKNKTSDILKISSRRNIKTVHILELLDIDQNVSYIFKCVSTYQEPKIFNDFAQWITIS